MIVGSLLLILIAVILLGLGLARGSDPLLVGSIAASLLAAIVLIVGARRPALLESFAAEPGRRRAGRSDGDEDPGTVGAVRDAHAPPGVPVSPAVPAGTGDPPVESSEPGPGAADVEPVDVEPAQVEPFELEPVEVEPSELEQAELEPVPAAHLATGVDTGPVAGHPAVLAEQATTVAPPQSPVPPNDAGTATGADRGPGGIPEQQSGAPEQDTGVEIPLEDPPDEPPSSTVDPADRARIATMSDEVVVVDFRPRYHLADCPFLLSLGGESERLPVGEAVELGFTPCSRCDPDGRILGTG